MPSLLYRDTDPKPLCPRKQERLETAVDPSTWLGEEKERPERASEPAAGRVNSRIKS